MAILNVPYFDPPPRDVELSLNAAKLLQSAQNCAKQMAMHDRSAEVTPNHVLEAMKLLLNSLTDGGTLIVPSGLRADSHLKPNLGRG